MGKATTAKWVERVRRHEARIATCGHTIFTLTNGTAMEFLGYGREGWAMVRRRVKFRPDPYWSDQAERFDVRWTMTATRLYDDEPRTKVSLLRREKGLLTARQFYNKHVPKGE